MPALILLGKRDYGIRFYGLPFGYEFKPFTEDIINVSRGTTSLSTEIKKKLVSIRKPVHIKIFVQLTCPYCPRVTSLAHRFAIESEFIIADVIDVTEFPYLGEKYSVMSIPKTIINETRDFVGVILEEAFIQEIEIALRPLSSFYV